MKKVAAVVVTYNRKKLLLENIECLLHQSYDNLDIIIIDNCSSDGTEEALSCYIRDKKIRYHNTCENLGGAGGFHCGIRIACELGYEYVWVMDDDCMPTENALEEFMKSDSELNGQYGFLSSKVLWTDGNVCQMNLQRRTMTKNVTYFSQKRITVVMASFVSLFFKSSTVYELGLPIKEFFIWTDDWEFTRRISRKYLSYVVTDSVVIHKSAQNIGAKIENDSLERLPRYRYLYRNDVYLYRREGIKGFFYELTRINFHMLRILFKAKNKRFKRIGMVIKGTREGRKFKPQIEYPEKKN